MTEVEFPTIWRKELIDENHTLTKREVSQARPVVWLQAGAETRNIKETWGEKDIQYSKTLHQK